MAHCHCLTGGKNCRRMFLLPKVGPLGPGPKAQEFLRLEGGRNCVRPRAPGINAASHLHPLSLSIITSKPSIMPMGTVLYIYLHSLLLYWSKLPWHTLHEGKFTGLKRLSVCRRGQSCPRCRPRPPTKPRTCAVLLPAGRGFLAPASLRSKR